MKTSKAQPFTYNYSQPEEYHFSLDSIQIADIVSGQISKDYSKLEIQNLQILDLCAGCGVIGFELSWYQKDLRNLDFVEVQEVYSEHFLKNLEIINRPEMNYQFHLMNYEKLKGVKWENKYDILVCNPPYFQVGQGKLSPSEFKNRCRFYMDSTFEKLIESILRVLKPNGQAYILVRSLSDHKLNLLDDLKKMTMGSASLDLIADVRGTHLVKIQKATQAIFPSKN